MAHCSLRPCPRSHAFGAGRVALSTNLLLVCCVGVPRGIAVSHALSGCALQILVIMEYACTTLAKVLLNFGKLPLASIKRYTRQVTCGLRYLHKHRVVHRDVKPQNILIAQSDVCKLSDFGTASILTTSAQNGRDGLMGTPQYMAPEMLRGRVGMPADVWALGITVTEMLSGQPLMETTNPAAALYRLGQMKEAPPLPAGVSEETRDFLTACLQFDPDQRPTAQDLLNSAPLLQTHRA